jgi:adenylate kinase family enzyme
MSKDTLYTLSSAVHNFIEYVNFAKKGAIYHYKVAKDNEKLDESFLERVQVFYEKEEEMFLEYLENIHNQTKELLECYKDTRSIPKSKPDKEKSRKKDEQENKRQR